MTLVSDAGQGRRERPLGADDVVVEAADQRAGVGAGEEGDGHAPARGRRRPGAGRGSAPSPMRADLQPLEQPDGRRRPRRRGRSAPPGRRRCRCCRPSTMASTAWPASTGRGHAEHGRRPCSGRGRRPAPGGGGGRRPPPGATWPGSRTAAALPSCIALCSAIHMLMSMLGTVQAQVNFRSSVFPAAYRYTGGSDADGGRPLSFEQRVRTRHVPAGQSAPHRDRRPRPARRRLLPDPAGGEGGPGRPQRRGQDDPAAHARRRRARPPAAPIRLPERIGWLPQDTTPQPGVEQGCWPSTTCSTPAPWHGCATTSRAPTSRCTRPGADADALDDAVHRYGDLEERFRLGGGYELESNGRAHRQRPRPRRRDPPPGGGLALGWPAPPPRAGPAAAGRRRPAHPRRAHQPPRRRGQGVRHELPAHDAAAPSWWSATTSS